MRENDFLICPVCGARIEKTEKSFICVPENGKKIHCFDISSSGYSDLSYRNGGSGDPKDAVTDRTAFLEKGYYQPLSDAINSICSRHLSNHFFLIDAGCGEGYYSERIASSFENAYVFGADLSKHAVHRASVRRNMRSGKNSFYCVASLFSLPVKDESADCVLSMFAPVAEQEVLRVLKKSGILIIGAAGRHHLYGLKDAIYDEVRLNAPREDLPVSMQYVDKLNVKYNMSIDNSEDILRLFGMTPYRFRTSLESLNRLRALTTLETVIDVDFYIYKK